MRSSPGPARLGLTFCGFSFVSKRLLRFPRTHPCPLRTKSSTVRMKHMLHPSRLAHTSPLYSHFQQGLRLLALSAWCAVRSQRINYESLASTLSRFAIDLWFLFEWFILSDLLFLSKRSEPAPRIAFYSATKKLFFKIH